MRYLFIFAFASTVSLSACSTTDKSAATADTIPAATTATIAITDTIVQTKAGADKTEILGLIQKMLKWSDSDEGHVDLLPMIFKDSVCVGFDMTKVDQAATRIKETGMFADEFIDNYKHLTQTLSKKIKNGDFGKWSGQDIPPFSFASDISPWCSCQDNFLWDDVEITVVKMGSNKAELTWNWGEKNIPNKQERDAHATPFKVVKTGGHWKIAYLKGFDYNDSIKGVKY